MHGNSWAISDFVHTGSQNQPRVLLRNSLFASRDYLLLKMVEHNFAIATEMESNTQATVILLN